MTKSLVEPGFSKTTSFLSLRPSGILALLWPYLGEAGDRHNYQALPQGHQEPFLGTMGGGSGWG